MLLVVLELLKIHILFQSNDFGGDIYMRKMFFGVMFVFFVILSITFFNSSNKERKEFVYNGNKLMISIDGVESLKLPGSGNYYLARYDCKNKNTVVSWNNKTFQLSVSNGNKKGGVSCYLDFESTPLLSDMKAGSYVAYVGNNGCDGDYCKGENANYVNENQKGYCQDSTYQFSSRGFRIAYSRGGSAYLVSAGAVECSCTNSGGSKSLSCDSALSVNGISSHVDNLNSIALKYCNVNYVSSGVCNNSNVRNINQDDFDLIVKRGQDISTCLGLQNKKCGYVNDLIDNGGYYWYSTISGDSSFKVFYWDGVSRSIRNSDSSLSYGVRPVIKMDANVIVVGGDGTESNPYLIGNRSFIVHGIDKDNSTVSLKIIGDYASKVCININSTVCTNYVDIQDIYLLDINGISSSDNIIYAYFKDENDNIVATVNRKIVFDWL